MLNSKSSGEFYRGKRKKVGVAVILVAILIVFVVFAAMMFYGLQKYIVVTNDGIKLDIPFINGGASVMTQDDDGNVIIEYEPVDAELVVGEADYSNVMATAGDGLEKFKAGFISAGNITESGVTSYVEAHEDINAIILDVKPAAGTLPYKSEVEFATAYGLNGQTELEPVISALKEKKIYVAAQVSCLVDNGLSSHYSQMILSTEDGSQYSDGIGTWLNPYNSDLRSYVIEICRELASMGVDEIIFTNLKVPGADVNTYAFSASTSTPPTAISAVSGFALDVTRALKSSNVKLSVRCDSEAALVSGEDPATGQNAELLFKVFDRVFCYTAIDKVGTLSDGAEKLIEVGNVDTRFVPMCTGETPDTPSWVFVD